jgi:uncharacterized protein (TIGR02453 family)
MAVKKKKAVAGTTGGFRGFGSQALPFLRALRENNDRDWFAENKSTYLEECDAPLRELVREVGDRLEAEGISLAPQTKSPVFRIYRDVRFSTDKSPYKTNVGAALLREGDKSRPGMLYIHIEPERSFLAAGFYHPDSPMLKSLRQAIVEDEPGFAKVVEVLASNHLQMGDGEPLARMPKGFEASAESPFAGAIRNRSFLVSRPLIDEDLERRDLPESVVQFAIGALPMLEFFWSRVG